MVRNASPSVLALLLALWGCAPAPVPASTRAAAPGECEALFRQYDLRDRTISQTRRDRFTIPPELQIQAGRLRNAGCITLTRDLVLDAASSATLNASGAPILPVTLHAGVVTNMADAAAARAFFEARGVRARSVGDVALGRRIFIGPFTTAGGLASAADLARSAGFDHPYPRSF